MRAFQTCYRTSGTFIENPTRPLSFPAFSGSLLGSGQGPPQDLAGFGKAEGRASGFMAYGWKTLNPKHLSPPNSGTKTATDVDPILFVPWPPRA